MKRRKGERRQDFLLRAHDAEGIRLFRKRRWDKANVGWGQCDTSIASKVYGPPYARILTTYLSKDGNTVDHEVSDYHVFIPPAKKRK